MSRGITKPQFAIAVTKGKILELKWVLEHASGGGSWRRVITTRIAELEEELKIIEGNVIAYKDMQQKGLIS